MDLLGGAALCVTLGVALIFFGMAIRGWVADQANARVRELLRTAKMEVPEFDPSQAFVNVERTLLIAAVPPIDPRELVLVEEGRPVRRYPAREIVGVEVLWDGVPVARTDRRSKGAGVGSGEDVSHSTRALAGGISSEQLTTSMLATIELHIRIHDPQIPLIVVSYLQLNSHSAVTPAVLDARRRASSAAQRWHARIASMIEPKDRALR